MAAQRGKGGHRNTTRAIHIGEYAMGAAHRNSVARSWHGLEPLLLDRAKILAFRVGNDALPILYAKWRTIARWFGHARPDSEAARSVVKWTIRRLCDVGFLVRLGVRAGNGRTAEYALQLSPTVYRVEGDGVSLTEATITLNSDAPSPSTRTDTMPLVTDVEEQPQVSANRLSTVIDSAAIGDSRQPEGYTWQPQEELLPAATDPHRNTRPSSTGSSSKSLRTGGANQTATTGSSPTPKRTTSQPKRSVKRTNLPPGAGPAVSPPTRTRPGRRAAVARRAKYTQPSMVEFPKPASSDACADLTARDVLGAFIDYCSARDVVLPPRFRGRYGRQIKELLADGIEVRLIKWALKEMLDHNVIDRPHLLDAFLVRVQTGPERRGGKLPKLDQRVADWLTVGRDEPPAAQPRAVGW